MQIFLALICKDKDFPSDVYKTWEEGINFLRSPKDSRDHALAGKFRNTASGLVVRVSGCRYRGLGFDSRRYQIF